MPSRVNWLMLTVCLALLGCYGQTPYTPSAGGPSDDTSGGGDVTANDATDEDASDGDFSGDSSDGTALTGRILAPGAAKLAPRSEPAQTTYTVVAQSDETGLIFRTETDDQGDFELGLPDDENGNSFMVTILGPDGRVVGSMLFDSAGDDAVTGLTPEGNTSLGTIGLPEDPTAQPITPGDDADVDELIDPDLTARLDQNGVPVGLASFGKGRDAQRDDGAGDQTVDTDRDGLIDVFDADDDGDGVVDDFDGDGDAGGIPDDMIVNFFMNLKIAAENAAVYYDGSAAEIDTALSTDTIITFEVMSGPSAARVITGARLLDSPAPSYIPTSDQMTDGGGGLVFTPWADVDYAFDDAGDRFEVFVRPNDVMNAGDTFTVEVEFGDGTAGVYSRMINYVFKNIPKLVQYGASGALQDFDISDPTVNGTPNQPIHFDGTQDLVLVYNPPLDETGTYLTGLDYTFQIFYHAASDESQLNGDIDVDATWPSPPTGFEDTTYRVYADDLTLSVDDTYTVTLPAELFPDTVHTTAVVDEPVGYYKIDITAECSSGNAAIMLAFAKD